MAPTAPSSLRDQALPLAGMADEASIHKFNDLIARQAIAGVPEIILAKTGKGRGSSGNGKACQLTALPPWYLNSRLVRDLPLKIGSWSAPDGSLSLVEIPFASADMFIRPMALGCWDDVAGLVSEAAIDELGYVFRSKPANYQFADRGLLRAFWRLISGEGPPAPARKESEATPHRIFFDERRAAHGRGPEFPYWLNEKLSVKHPVLMVRARQKHVLAIRLRRPVEPLAGSLTRRRIAPDDVLDVNPFINPFYEAAEQTSNRLARQLSVAPAAGGAEEDAAFMDLLKTRFILNGRGAYRNFSIQNWGSRDGKLCISVCLSMGRRPFLQQTLPEPVFIHWDLRNYPVSVFAHMAVGSDTRTDVVNCDTLVECNHPSICRHAFVRRLQEGGPPHYGVVCTESTRFRLLQLLSRGQEFDPAQYLVEKLRSAARVLRYGLRRRDMGISQHNKFANVPETEFQAVIRGYYEARRFAGESRAEIVYFDR